MLASKNTHWFPSVLSSTVWGLQVWTTMTNREMFLKLSSLVFLDHLQLHLASVWSKSKLNLFTGSCRREPWFMGSFVPARTSCFLNPDLKTSLFICLFFKYWHFSLFWFHVLLICVKVSHLGCKEKNCLQLHALNTWLSTVGCQTWLCHEGIHSYL